MTTSAAVRAVVLVRTARRREETARLVGSIEGVRRVERVQGPYDLVVHAAGAEEIDAIERLPGVTGADVCWLSPRARGGAA